MTTINIAHGQTLRGAFETDAGDTVTINGPGKFAPTAFIDNSTATINADVVGVGSFVTGIGTKLTFGGSVGNHNSVFLALNSTITIEKPTEFKGSIGFAQSIEPREGPFGEYVDLVGLSKAESYTIKNDLLSIRAGNGHVIDQVHLQPGFDPAVIKDGADVYLTLGYGGYRIPGGVEAGQFLPDHK
jgi:hypothetical protein